MSTGSATIRCVNCTFFVPPPKRPEGAEAYGIDGARGSCRRYPRVENKHSDDFCGEFRQRSDT